MALRGNTQSRLFGVYLHAPILSRQEELALGERVSKGDLAARDKLILSYGRVVGGMARKRANNLTEFEDMLQEGLLAMLEHASQFDPSRGVLFGTYLRWWVKAALQVWRLKQDNAVKLPDKATHYASLIHRISGTFAAKHGREPTSAEMAHILGKSEKQVANMLRALDTQLVYLSQDLPIHEDATVEDSLVDHNTLTPEEAIIAKEELRDAHARVVDMLVTLATHPRISDRDREAFKLYMGIDSTEKATLQDVADMFHISRERVRQIISRVWRLISGEKAGWNDNPFKHETQAIELLRELV